MSKLKDYALYKGDELLFVGTAKEIAEHFNISERTVRHYNTPTYRKRVSSKGRRLVALDN